MRSSIAALTLLTLTTGAQADPLVQREFSGRDNRFIEMPGAGFRAMASGKRISFDAQGMSIDLPAWLSFTSTRWRVAWPSDWF